VGFRTQRRVGLEAQRVWLIRRANRKAQGEGDESHSVSFDTSVGHRWPVIRSDNLNATFGYLSRLKKNGQRGRAIEYTLIALLITFAALQAFFAVVLKAI
jgi:hypothetical protein